MRLVALACSLVLCTALPVAHAQTQVGGHYSAIALEYPDQTRSGFGGFLVYSPREWIGVDIGTTVFLSEPIGGNAWQLLAGPRVGGTVAGLGVFGRVRPGFVRFSERFYAPDIVCILIFPPPESCLARATSFALDLGGTVEVSPSPATVLRFDLGDTLTHYRPRSGAQSSPGAERDGSWKHGLQFVAGMGWKF